MKKNYKLFLLPFIFISLKSFSQVASFCGVNGNIAIYSNYDGGILRINADTNIANLKIGICGYENDSVIISGAYVNNITQVIFAGYYNSSNVHCNPWPSQKSINGVSAAITQINFVPVATYSNPYGYLYIICNTDCDDSTYQGGGDTPDQVVYYFLNEFSNSKLLFHYTQYGCWNGTYNISDGGNCCIVPLGTGIIENSLNENILITPNPNNGNFTIQSSIFNFQSLAVYDIFGNIVLSHRKPEARNFELDLSNHPKGIYFIKISTGKEMMIKKIVYE
ncbi:MAG: T9SS type A sorting domain-containing protein [Bacteroidota bacterium]